MKGKIKKIKRIVARKNYFFFLAAGLAAGLAAFFATFFFAGML
jgi:hypothetical protein